MLKSLTIAVFFAIVLPINGQQDSSQAGDNQQAPKHPQWTVPCLVKNDTSAPECDWSKAEPNSYFKRLFSPENTPNIALFLIGIPAVVVAFCTLRTIEKQTDALIVQNRTMIAKERARFDISAEGLEIERDEAGHWNFMATINVRNIGSEKAFIIRSAGELITTHDTAQPSIPDKMVRVYSLSLPEKFIDSAAPPPPVNFYEYPSASNFLPDDLAGVAAEIASGGLTQHLHGFIEYETMGTNWRNDFWFTRQRYDNLVIMMVRSTPMSAEQMVTKASYWKQQKNEEREINPN